MKNTTRKMTKSQSKQIASLILSGNVAWINGQAIYVSKKGR